MVKKRKLNIEYSIDLKAFGIYSTLKDYRFCWMLNKHLGFDMKRIPDLPYIPKKTHEPVYFPVFHHEIPELRTQLFLVVNRSINGILCDQPKNMDYLFMVKSPDSETVDNLVNSLKTLPDVQTVFTLDTSKNKRNTTVLYDFELFLSTNHPDG